MGNGYRDGQFLNFQVTADYDLTDDDRGRWERAFAKASEILWNATEGQLRFGTVLFADQNAGATNAELILNADTGGRALGTSGGWGRSGKAIFQPAYAQVQVMTLLHELGHHIWRLGEEYADSESLADRPGCNAARRSRQQDHPVDLVDRGQARLRVRRC